MPSPRIDPPGPGRAETGLLVGMALMLGLLLAESVGIGTDAVVSPVLVGGLPPLALSLVVLARRLSSHCLHMAVFMGGLGSIGLLIGARLDFGPLGLVTLTGWCSVLPALGLDAAWNKVSLAPWSYGGMLAGCNLGMALSAHLVGPSPARRRTFLLRYLACNGGMIIGMFLAEALLPAFEAGIEGGSAVAAMFLTMIFGMTAGMWVGWWSAEWAIRGWRRAVSTAGTAAIRVGLRSAYRCRDRGRGSIRC